VIVTEPGRGPAAVGVKVIASTQLFPGVTVVPQVEPALLIPNSLLIEMSDITRFPLADAAFATVTSVEQFAVVPTAVSGQVPEPVTVAAGTPMPFPLNGTLCGLPAALSMTVRKPVKLPDAFGVKLTVIRHDDPG
jgi:hypothetical protein